MAPTDEILRERAAAVFPAIIEGVDRWSRTMQQLVLSENVSLEPLPALPDIFSEALYFTLHVVDRFAFGQLDEHRRAVFMDGLLNAVASGLQDARVDVETTREAYNELQREYGHFRFPQVGESPLATIEWAFASASRSGQVPAIR